MPIFQTKSKKIGGIEVRHVGVTIPQPVRAFLSLYCLANGTTKTAVINQILLDWMNQEMGKGLDGLVLELIKKAKTQYHLKIVDCPGTTLLSFQNELFEELQQKGIDMAIIKMIIKQLL